MMNQKPNAYSQEANYTHPMMVHLAHFTSIGSAQLSTVM